MQYYFQKLRKQLFQIKNILQQAFNYGIFWTCLVIKKAVTSEEITSMNGHLGPNMHFTAATSSSPSTALDSLRQFQYLLRQPLYIEIAYTAQYNINQGSTPLVHCYWSQAQTQFLWSQGYSSLLRKDKTFASTLYVCKVLGSEELLGLEKQIWEQYIQQQESKSYE